MAGASNKSLEIAELRALVAALSKRVDELERDAECEGKISRWRHRQNSRRIEGLGLAYLEISSRTKKGRVGRSVRRPSAGNAH